MTPNHCDFTTIGTLDTGHSLLVCIRGGCGKTVKVRGKRCRAVCRVQPEGYVRPPFTFNGLTATVAECAGCEEQARLRRERAAKALPREVPSDYPGAATDDV